MTHTPRIAFVYDWFDTSVGGAERVIQTLHEMYPQAPWYTSHIDHARVAWAKGWDIRPSFLQYAPLWFRRNRILSLLFLPFAFESFDFSSYDVVVSVSSGFAKNIVTRVDTKHICYLLSPPRWLYNFQFSPFTGRAIFNFQLFKWLEQRLRNYLRGWDYGGAQRVDEFVSISQEVAKRCKTYYDRESGVVYPPFDYNKWNNLTKLVPRYCEESADSVGDEAISLKNGIAAPATSLGLAMTNQEMNVKKSRSSALFHFPYYLIVSRLEPYKRVEVAVEAFSIYNVQFSCLAGRQAIFNTKHGKSKETLVIVGGGTQKARLKALSSRLKIDDSTLWIEGVRDEELAWLYAHCKAFIMPQEEDYGYVALEAMSCGAPIVAYAKGGQIEPLGDYLYKVLCEVQTPECFAQALEKIGDIQYNAQTYEDSHIRRGSRDTFVAALSQKITQTV